MRSLGEKVETELKAEIPFVPVETPRALSQLRHSVPRCFSIRAYLLRCHHNHSDNADLLQHQILVRLLLPLEGLQGCHAFRAFSAPLLLCPHVCHRQSSGSSETAAEGGLHYFGDRRHLHSFVRGLHRNPEFLHINNYRCNGEDCQVLHSDKIAQKKTSRLEAKRVCVQKL